LGVSKLVYGKPTYGNNRRLVPHDKQLITNRTKLNVCALMKRTVTISTQSDLEQTWTDSSCPNITWGFTEQDLEDCLQDDGTYVATYETIEIPTGETMSFTYLTSSGETTYTLEAGEYGIRPSE